MREPARIRGSDEAWSEALRTRDWNETERARVELRRAPVEGAARDGPGVAGPSGSGDYSEAWTFLVSKYDVGPPRLLLSTPPTTARTSRSVTTFLPSCVT